MEEDEIGFGQIAAWIGKGLVVLVVFLGCAYVINRVATHPDPPLHWTRTEAIFAACCMVAGAFVHLWIWLRLASSKSDPTSATAATCFALVALTAIIIYFAIVYADYGMIDADKVVTHDMPTALYFSVVTFATLGYGDILPTREARLFVCIEAIAGMSYVGLLISMFVIIGTRAREAKK